MIELFITEDGSVILQDSEDVRRVIVVPAAEVRGLALRLESVATRQLRPHGWAVQAIAEVKDR